tara:strand:+ start:387 stop:530 length:144 start_codon:yes stop_codon:yes gene_type:complete
MIDSGSDKVVVIFEGGKAAAAAYSFNVAADKSFTSCYRYFGSIVFGD